MPRVLASCIPRATSRHRDSQRRDVGRKKLAPSDIALDLVEGVHGPRILEMLIVGRATLSEPLTVCYV
jgi:hypothetical protein